MSDAAAPVLVSVADRVASIRFNRPDRLNALDMGLATAFAAAVDEAVADAHVRVVVLSRAGRAFMAGGDLDHFRGPADRGAAAHELIGPIHRALTTLAMAPQIVVASVHGAIAGGGMSIALGADLAIAAADAAFNMAYAKVAAPPDCGGSWALPRLVGLRKAMEIALLSETIRADEALRLGLVNRVVPAAALHEETRALAVRLASGPPIAQGRIKALLRGSFAASWPAQLDAEAEGFAACARTADFGEAIDAFFAKRRPAFEGR